MEEPIAEEQEENSFGKEDSYTANFINRDGPIQAVDLQQSDVRQMLKERGITPTGFPRDDALRLQMELDREWAEESERREEMKRQAEQKAKRELENRKRQADEERKQQEEGIALSNDPKMAFWVTLAQKSETPPIAVLQVTPITARAFSKALASNTSLVSLDLSRNFIGDETGAQLANMLEKNQTLTRLQLEDTGIGHETAVSLGNSLRSNRTLAFLSLQSNNLTADGRNNSGINALATMLEYNNTIVYLSLFRTKIGHEGGLMLARNIQRNSKIVALNIGYNDIGVLEKRQIRSKLQQNKQDLERRAEEEKKRNAIERAEQKTKKEQQEKLQKEQEEKEWIEEQRRLRAEARAKKAEDERRKREEEIKRLEDEMKRRREEEAAKKKAAEESAKKKKSKKKK